MKLYDSTGAPNPRRVRVFLAEKGIEVPLVQVGPGLAVQAGDHGGAVGPARRQALCAAPDDANARLASETGRHL